MCQILNSIDSNNSSPQYIGNNSKKYKELREVIESELDTNVVEGTELNVSDSAEYRGKIDVIGNTYQKQLAGKNKFDYITYLNSTANGLISTVDEDGNITITGKPLYNYIKIVGGIDIYDLLEDGETYTLVNEFNTPLIVLQISLKKSDNSGYDYVGSSTTNRIFTMDKSKYSVATLMLQTTTTEDWGNENRTFTGRAMLYKGTGDDTFEPYCGGQPSPNPDYPQNIEVVTGYNIVKHIGRNKAKSYVINESRYQYNHTLYIDTELEVGKKYVLSYVDKSIGNQYYRNEYCATDVPLYSITSTGQRQYYYFTCKDNNKEDSRIYSKGKGYIILKNFINLSASPQFEEVQIEEIESYSIIPKPYEEYRETYFNFDLASKNRFVGYDNMIEGFLEASGPYPTNNNNYPNARYQIIELKAGESLTTSGSTSAQGRIRLINKQTNKLVETIAATSNNFYVSTATYTGGFNNGTITAKVDILLGILLLEDVDNLQLQIDKGTTASDYEEWGSMELCKIDDHEDILFKNVVGDENYNAELEERAWYKKEAIYSNILDGSENISLDTTKERTQVFKVDILNNAKLKKPKSYTTILSNYFMYNRPGDVEKITFSSDSFYIACDKSIASTIAEFKMWLSTNNVTIKYVLAETTYTKITDPTLISQLEALRKAKWFKGVNHWWTETDNLEPVLKGTYKQSNNLRIKEQDERLTNLESRLALLE